MTVGKKLRKLRGERSLDTMAELLGITKSSLAMYERDERVPRDEIKVKIATFFNLTVGELFFNENEHE